MIRTVYHFDDLGRKVPVGSYDDGMLPVGGRIFYINSNSDETVKFYDSQGVELQSVVVGDAPSYYKVTSTGVSGKDKFYVYREESIPSSKGVWAYYENGDWVFETIGTSNSIGYGKINTSKVLAAHDGAYINSNSQGSATIWYYLNSIIEASAGGCDDWYIGSSNELGRLLTFVVDNYLSLGITNIFADNVKYWTSSETGSDSSTFAYMTGGSSFYKYGKDKIVPIRSF